jgi:putative peptidoglycan lipid II flippase
MTGGTSPAAGRRLGQVVLTVAAVTAMARVVGFVRVLVFAHTVGPSCLGDAYFTANTIPNILFDIVAGGALSSLAVPVLASAVDAGDDATADRTASALLTWTLVLLLPVLVLGILLSGPLVHALVGNGNPGCDVAAQRAVGARMLEVFMPQVLFYGVGVVLIGILQAHRRFIGPALAPLVSSAVVVAAYLVFGAVSGSGDSDLAALPRSHELVLSLGTTLGVAVLTLPLWWSLRRTHRRLRPSLTFPPGVGASARRMAIAGAVVLGSQDLATAAILRLANDGGGRGSVVFYNLAWTVFLLPWSVLAVPLATTAFPTLTARWQAGDRDEFTATTARTARLIVFVTAGAAAVLVAVARPAAAVLAFGAPGGVSPRELARALVAFAPGLVGYGLVAHLSRAHYARGRAGTTATATAVGWAIAVALDVALVAALPRSWAAAALAAGTAVGVSVTAVWMAVVLARGAGARALGGAARVLVAGVGSAALAAALGTVVARSLPSGGVGWSAVVVAVVVVAAVGVYLALMAVAARDTTRLLFAWRPRRS